MFESLRSYHPAWYIVLYVAVFLAMFMGVVAAIVFLLRKVLRKHKQYDLDIFQRLRSMQTPANNRIMLVITYLGKQQFLIPANLLVIGFFFFFSLHYWYAFNILIVSLSSLLLMLLFKELFHRKRPEVPLLFTALGKSFPSGHAMMSVCFYGFLMHILLQLTTGTGTHVIISIVCIGLIVLIGFSRVYFQVHYVTDVLAGFAIGSAWLCVALRVFNALQYVA